MIDETKLKDWRATQDDLKQDAREVRRLRNYYRRNFHNGESDECFINWVETTLRRINDGEV